MKKNIQDLNQAQREQFEMFMRAEGFKNIVPEIIEDINIKNTMFIKDKVLKINLENGKQIDFLLKKARSLEEKINSSQVNSKTIVDSKTTIQYKLLSEDIVIDFSPGLFTTGFRGYRPEKFRYKLYIDIPYSILADVPEFNFIFSEIDLKRLNKYYFDKSQGVEMDKSFYENIYTIDGKFILNNQNNYNVGLAHSGYFLTEKIREAKNIEKEFKVYYSFNNKNDIQKEFNKFFSPIAYWENNFFNSKDSNVRQVISLIKLDKDDVEDFYKDKLEDLIKISFDKRGIFKMNFEKYHHTEMLYEQLINKEGNSFFKNILISRFNELLFNFLYNYLLSFKINQLASCPKNLEKMIKNLIEEEASKQS